MKESDVDVVVGGGKDGGKNLANSSFNIHSITELSLSTTSSKKEAPFSWCDLHKAAASGERNKGKHFYKNMRHKNAYYQKRVSPFFIYIFWGE